MVLQYKHLILGGVVQRTIQPKYPSLASGFTIVELLIVVVVIAILATITIVSYNNITKRSTESLLKADLNTAAKKLGIIQAETGNYPSEEVFNDKINTFSQTDVISYSPTGVGGIGYCLVMASPKYSDLTYSIDQTGSIHQDGNCVSPVANNGPSTPENCFVYRTDPDNSNVSQITDYNVAQAGCGPNVVIPSSLGGKPVTAIGIGAGGYGFYGKGLTSVVIPETAETIGLYAFFNNQITTVTIPQDLLMMGAYSFSNNPGIVCHVPTGSSFGDVNTGCTSRVFY